MAYKHGHEIQDSLKDWRNKRILAGRGSAAARTYAAHISAMAHELGIEPERLPADAVVRHFQGRDVKPSTAAAYDTALRLWLRYLETGDVSGRRYTSGSGTTTANQHNVRDRKKDPDIDHWITVMSTDGKAPGTINAYVGDVKGICRHAGKKARRLTEADVRSYLMTRHESVRASKGRPLRAGYHNRILQSVRSLWEAHGWKNDPSAKIKRARRDVVHHKPVDQDDLVHMLTMATRQRDTRDGAYADMGRRMHTMIKLMSSMGMRLSESARTRPEDLEYIDGVWYLKAIGTKHRHMSSDVYLPCTNAVVDDLTTNYQRTDTVMPAEWDVARLSATFSGWCKSIGLKGVTAHRLRAYYATHLYYRSNHNLALVMRRLRHAQVETTMAYIALLDTDEEARLVTNFDDNVVDIVVGETASELQDRGVIRFDEHGNAKLVAEALAPGPQQWPAQPARSPLTASVAQRLADLDEAALNRLLDMVALHAEQPPAAPNNVVTMRRRK